MGLYEVVSGIFAKKHVKTGLALGSGGAKGAALVGVLKAFEEQGLKFDIVAGTSIGSIVGAMVALGYSSDDMLAVIKQYAVTDQKQLLMMTLKGTTVADLLANVLGEKTFDDTILPFAAVACDVNTGEEVVMKSGSLATALAASGAIPPVFRPVGRDNRKLVDGAFVNAVPADVVKNMGADIVVSINLTSVADNSKSKAALDTLYPANGVALCDRLHQLTEFSDFVISPDVSAFSSSDVGAAGEMYSIGYSTAVEKLPELIKLLKERGANV